MPEDIIDLELMEFFTHTKKSSWDRVQSNPNLQGKFTKNQCRRWDQLFSLQEKLCQMISDDCDDFLEERPALILKHLGRVTITPKNYGSKQKKISALARELSELSEEIRIEEVFNET